MILATYQINARQKALVVIALVEFVDRVYVAHSGEIAEDDLVWTDTDNRTVRFEKLLNALALSKSNDVDKKKNIGDGIVPGARYRAERRQEEVVDNSSQEISRGGSCESQGKLERRWKEDRREHVGR